MERITQNRQSILLETSLGENTLIPYLFEGQEVISNIFTYRIECFSQELDIQEDGLVGKNITIQLNKDENNIRFFNGIVKNLSKKNISFRGTRNYEIQVVPWLWFLTLSQDCKVFQNKSTIEIIQEVFKDHNQYDYDLSLLTKEYLKREYCIQYNETAFNFVNRLLEEEGIFYYFLSQKNKHTLYLVDTIARTKKNLTQDIEFSQGITGKVCIKDWVHNFTLSSGKFSQTDYDFTKPKVDLLSSSVSNSPFMDTKNIHFFEFPGNFIDRSQGQSTSKLRIEEKESFYNCISGIGEYSSFSPGTRFSIENKELSTEEGEYFLISVDHFAQDFTHSHKIHSDQNASNSPNYLNNFKCMDSKLAFRPRRDTPKPHILGVQSAIVVGPENEEIYTDKYGRIKIQFFWDREGKKNEQSSCWVRVVQAWVGAHWGQIFIPRVGQEVIIGFMDGNPDKPIVIGSLYNADNMTPYTLPSNQTRSGIKTKSTPRGNSAQGNEIYFEDKKDHEEIFLHAQKDLNSIVENDMSLTVNSTLR